MTAAVAVPLLASVAMTGIGTVFQGLQSSAQMRQQQAVLQNQNAALRNQQAANAEAYQERERRRQAELQRVLSARRARYAAMGVDPTVGSAVAVQEGLQDDAADQQAFDYRQLQRQNWASGLSLLENQFEVSDLSRQRRSLPLMGGITTAAFGANQLISAARTNPGAFGLG